MSRVVAELTLEPGTRPQTLPASVPPEVIRYARGMFQTTRDSLRFLWRHDDTWLSVHLVRTRYDPESAAAVRRSSAWAAGERVSVRVSEVDMPRGITVREVDVLTLLALGLTNSGIAERLGTSARTVSTQIERLLTKLDQGTRGGLAALAVDSGLLRLPIPGGVDGTPGIGVVELEAVVSKVPRAEVAPLRPLYPRKRPLLVGCADPRPERPPPTGSRYCTGRLWPSRNSTPPAARPGRPGRTGHRRSGSLQLGQRGTGPRAAVRPRGRCNHHQLCQRRELRRHRRRRRLRQTVPAHRDIRRTGRADRGRPDPVRCGAPDMRVGDVLRRRPGPAAHRPRKARSVAADGPRRIVSIEAATSSTRVTNEHFLATAGRSAMVGGGPHPGAGEHHRLGRRGGQRGRGRDPRS